jgi:hypothetical protein
MKGLSKKQTIIWMGLTLVLLLSVGLALAGGTITSRDLVSSGGGSVSQSGLTLQTAVGQPAVGSVQNSQTLCSGFLCDANAPSVSGGEHELFLPFVIR